MVIIISIIGCTNTKVLTIFFFRIDITMLSMILMQITMINALIFYLLDIFFTITSVCNKKKYLQSFANTDCFILFVTSQTCLQCRMNFPLISTIVLYKKNKTTLNFIFITIDDYFSYFDEIISQNMSKYHIRYYDE